MIKTLIVYEDGKSDLERCARLIAEGLSPDEHEVHLKAASAVLIPDILASKLYFFGVETSPSPSYAEISRVFTGINLAGRSAAYFGPSKKAVSYLKTMAADTELKALGAGLVDASPSPEAVKAWLQGIL